MKGMELMASVFAILIMIGISSLLGGIFIMIMNIAEQPSSSPINYEMVMFASYPPVKYETMLLSYLETTHESGFQIKKILTYAAYQNNIDSIYVDGMEIQDLGELTTKIFQMWLPNEAYQIDLNINGNSLVIAKSSSPIRLLSEEKISIRKISVPVFIEKTTFTVQQNEKTPLPIDITLDFYVQ